MRYALVSDIHGNLQALEAVLSAIDELSVDRIVCLGDIVGYGADPSPCIGLVRQRCPEALLGNHDAAAVERTSIANFNPAASDAVLWTRSVLGEQDKAYLNSLDYRKEFDSFEIVHASPDRPEKWKYLLYPEDAAPQFGFFDKPLLFFGHTHYPLIFEQDRDSVIWREAGGITFQPGKKYIVNVGSVGQPRDMDPRACFAVFDSERRRLDFHRRMYDIGTAQRRILEHGLPPFLAERLSYGR